METPDILTVKNQTHGNATEVSYGEDLPTWARSVKLCYLFLIFLLATPGNSLIIAVELKLKEKVGMDYLVLTMACFELLCSTVNVFMQIVTDTKTIWYRIAETSLCKLFSFSGYLTTLSTAFLLAAIAVDRYMKTCRPLCGSYNTRTVKGVCVAVSVSSVVCSCPATVVFHLNEHKACVHITKLVQVADIWNKSLAFIVIIIFVTICVCYIKITYVLRTRHKTRLEERQSTEQSHPQGTQMFHSPKQTYKRFSRFVHSRNRRTGKVHPLIISKKERVSPFGSSMSTPQRHTTSDSVSVIAFSKETSRLKYAQQTEPFKAISFIPEAAQHDCANGRVATRPSGLCARRNVLKERRVNRTTLTMFLITFIYIITYGLSMLMVMTNYSVLGKIIQSLSKTFKMINCLTNPVLFLIMSSKFRSKAKQMVFGIGKRRDRRLHGHFF